MATMTAPPSSLAKIVNVPFAQRALVEKYSPGGRYIDAINEVLDPTKKTIIHIPSVRSAARSFQGVSSERESAASSKGRPSEVKKRAFPSASGPPAASGQ